MIKPKRRSELEIQMDILDALSQGNPSVDWILRKTNCSVLVFASVLTHLLSLGFVTPEGLRYEVTEKGHEALESYKKLRLLVP